MHTGKIKKIVQGRGFGFISDNDGRELFFHQSEIQGSDFNNLKDGQSVQFDVENTAKGPRATNISLVSD
jgi:CspA family cold shock protein